MFPYYVQPSYISAHDDSFCVYVQESVYIPSMIFCISNKHTCSTIFPRHQIWRLSYNLVTPLDGHSSRPKDHIRKAKALSECSCSKEHRDIKIFDTSHDTFLTYIGLKFNPCVTLLLVECVFRPKKHGSSVAPTRGRR